MARSFNGTSDFINAGNSATLNPTSALTLAAWVYQTSSLVGGAQQGWVIGRDDNTLGRSYVLGVSNFGSGAVYNLQINGTGTTTGSGELLNQWVHIAGVTSSATTQLSFLNGTQDTTHSYLAPNATTGNTTIGERTFAGNIGFWPGRIADAAIWNVALSAAEILALAKGARPYMVRESSLVGYWPLDGLQSPEPDLSGNANNGTLTGTALAAGPPVMMFTPWRAQGLTPSTFAAAAILMPQAIL